MSVVANVAINVDARTARQRLEDFIKSTKRANEELRATQTASQQAETAIGGITKAVGKLALAYGTLRTAQAALQAGISRIESERRIEFLAKEYGEASKLADAAARATERFGVSQTEANIALATTYARLRPVGVELEQIESVYAGFNTAARLSGSTALEASQAFRQLAQALGSGALRGDEFRSVSEQVPLILTAVSKETGIAQGQLRDYAAEGKLTADIVIRALQRIEREGADQLAEALDGPAQKIKDFQNAFENVQVALTQDVIPELTTSLSELGQLILNLEGPIKYIGGLLAGALGGANDLLGMFQKGTGGTRRAIEAGRLPLFNDLGIGGRGQGARTLFEGTGPGGSGLDEMIRQAKELSKLRNQSFNTVMVQLMQDRLKTMDAAVASSLQKSTFDTTTLDSIERKGKGKSKGKSAEETLREQLAAGKELATQFERRIQLNSTTNDLQRNLLQIEYDRLDAIKEINETAAASQITSLTASANADAELQKRKAIQEAVLSQTKSAEDLIKKYEEEAETQRQIEALVKDGVNPALAQQLVDIERQFETQKEQLKAYEGMLIAELGRKDLNKQTADELERQLKALRGIQGELDKTKKDTKDNAIENQGLTKEQQKQKKLYEDIYGVVSNQIQSAITGLIDGTKTWNDVLVDALSSLGNLFLSLAFEAAKAPLGAALGIPGFAEGGYVTSPTKAMIGEGGSSEYVIPANKMDSAMSRWNSGVRGNSVVSGADPTGGSGGVALAEAPTNIVVEGGVLNFNDSQYIRQDQVPAIVKQASAAGEAKALRKLQMSTATRKRIGL